MEYNIKIICGLALQNHKLYQIRETILLEFYQQQQPKWIADLTQREIKP